MPDKPETNGQKMGHLIRDLTPRSTRAAMTDAIRRAWTKTNPGKENDRD